MDYLVSKKDLETFSDSDIDLLVNHYNIKQTPNKDDTLWQLAVAILGNSKTGKMAPAKVFEKYGPQLFEKIKTDQSVRDNNPEVIKNKFIEMDPDGGKNVEWLVISYINGGIQKLEDLGRANVAIKKYNWLTARKLFDPNDPDLQFFRTAGGGSVTRSVTLVDFGGLVGYKNSRGQMKLGLEQFLEKYQTKLIPFEQPVKEILETDRILHYQDYDFILIEPLTKAASCKYGANTRWCTAAKKDNQFENYSEEGPLLIVIPKKENYPGEKYQLHFQSESFMNEKDKGVKLKDLYVRFPNLQTGLKVQYNNYITKHLQQMPENIQNVLIGSQPVMDIINTMPEADFENIIKLVLIQDPTIGVSILEHATRDITSKVLESLLLFVSSTKLLELINKNKINFDILNQNVLQRITSFLERKKLLYKRYINSNVQVPMELLLSTPSAGIVELLKAQKIRLTDLPPNIFEQLTAKDIGKIYSIDNTIFDNLPQATFIKILEKMMDNDADNIPEILQKMPSIPVEIYKKIGELYNELVIKLIETGKIDPDLADSEGRTIISYIGNIEVVDKVVQLKKQSMTQQDLEHLTDLVFTSKDLLPFSKFYSRDDFNKIVIKKLEDSSLIEDVDNLLDSPNIDLDKIFLLLYCKVPIYIKSTTLKRVLDDPRYPKWTFDNNPIKLVTGPLQNNCYNKIDKFTILLDHPNYIPFMKSLSPEQLNELIATVEKVDKKLSDLMIQKAGLKLVCNLVWL